MAAPCKLGFPHKNIHELAASRRGRYAQLAGCNNSQNSGVLRFYKGPFGDAFDLLQQMPPNFVSAAIEQREPASRVFFAATHLRAGGFWSPRFNSDYPVSFRDRSSCRIHRTRTTG
jgi:hypothetical protein